MTTRDDGERPDVRFVDAQDGRVVLPGGGSWLRILLTVAVVITLVVLRPPVDGSGRLVLELVLMVGFGCWAVARPGSAAPAVLLIGALSLRLILAHPQLDGSLIALVVLLPGVHQLSALSAVVPLRANVYWAALRPTAMRYFGAVLATVVGLILSHLLGMW